MFVPDEDNQWYEPPKPPCMKYLRDQSINAIESIESGDCLLMNYNEEFVDEHFSKFRTIAISLVLFGLVLNVLIYKWRKLVDYCLAYEFTLSIFHMSIPSDKNNYSVYTMLIYCVTVFAMSYTGKGSQIVQGTVFFYTMQYYFVLVILDDAN